MDGNSNLELSIRPDLPRTFVHDLVNWLPSLDKERVRYIDLSEREIAPPPQGLFAGENRFVVGTRGGNQDEQFLITDGLVDCSGLIIQSQDDKYLLAHIESRDYVYKMFEKFRESLGSPDRVKSVSVIPGYDHDSKIDGRIQAMLIEGMKLNPDELVVDIANGKPGDYRGIVQNTIEGGLYGIDRPSAPPRTMDKYSVVGARHVLR